MWTIAGEKLSLSSAGTRLMFLWLFRVKSKSGHWVVCWKVSASVSKTKDNVTLLSKPWCSPAACTVLGQIWPWSNVPIWIGCWLSFRQQTIYLFKLCASGFHQIKSLWNLVGKISRLYFFFKKKDCLISETNFSMEEQHLKYSHSSLPACHRQHLLPGEKGCVTRCTLLFLDRHGKPVSCALRLKKHKKQEAQLNEALTCSHTNIKSPGSPSKPEQLNEQWICSLWKTDYLQLR